MYACSDLNLYRNHCDGKHLGTDCNQLPTDEQFYPLKKKEDTAMEHIY